MEYVDSAGRVPRGLASIDGVHALNQALLVAIVLGKGGALDIVGLDEPGRIKWLLAHEVRVTALGGGRVRVEAMLREPEVEPEP